MKDNTAAWWSLVVRGDFAAGQRRLDVPFNSRIGSFAAGQATSL